MNFLLCLLSFFAVSLDLASQPKIENNTLVLDKSVLFKTGSTEMLPESEAVLKTVKTFLEQKTYISLLRVEAHVAVGTNSQTLSEQRAAAIVKKLVQEGLDCNRLLPVGFGDSKPVVATNSPDKAANSRIVFAIASLRGRPIGGLPADGGGKAVSGVCE